MTRLAASAWPAPPVQGRGTDGAIAVTRTRASGAGTIMHVSRWVALGLGFATTACQPETMSGGEIVDGSTAGPGDSGSVDSASAESDESNSEQTGQSDSASETGAAPGCADIPAPSCGDGIVEAVEECEGDAECEGCTSTRVAMVALQAFVELSPFVVSPDGSSFGWGEGSPPDMSMRRFDADGELTWATIPIDATVRDVALGTSEDTYAVGSSFAMTANGAPWITAYDDLGIDRWTVELPNAGWFGTIALGDDRVAAGGGNSVEAQARALLYVYDAAGVEQWSVIDPALLWIDDVAFVGTDVVAIASGLGVIDDVDDTRLMRYDASGEQLWSIALPDDGEPAQRPFGVISDGADGTWSFGQAASGPYVAHHDRDGTELESFECIGGATGWTEHAALGADNRLALGIELAPAGQAWFAVLDEGVVTRAASFGDPDSGNTAGPSAVQWLASGEMAAVWTEYPEEGGPGNSQLVVLTP